MSAVESRIDRLSPAPMSMQQWAYPTTTQGRIITNDQNEKVAPFSSLPSYLGVQSKPLPIPHHPALALSPHQQPTSFSRRSSMPYATGSPAPDSPAPRQQGSQATSFKYDPMAYHSASTHSYGASTQSGFAHHSPRLNMSGGLSKENTYRTMGFTSVPTSGSLSRACIQCGCNPITEYTTQYYAGTQCAGYCTGSTSQSECEHSRSDHVRPIFEYASHSVRVRLPGRLPFPSPFLLILDVEAMAAEWLLINVRAAALADRALSEARQFLLTFVRPVCHHLRLTQS